MRFLEWVDKSVKDCEVKPGAETRLRLAMPDKYKVYQEDYKCYQLYVKSEKSYSLWPDLNKIPDWWGEKSNKWVDKSFINGQYSKR